MAILLITVGVCGLFFFLCYLGTGSEEKNLKSLASYPDEVIKALEDNGTIKTQPANPNYVLSFISNVFMFSVIFGLLGLICKEDTFLGNFLNIFIIGEVLNLFDFLVIDLLWWRNSKRIRFKSLPDKALYQNPKKHFTAFLRGALCFLVVAGIVGLILSLF